MNLWLIGWLIALAYLAGFSITYRMSLRRLLTWWETEPYKGLFAPIYLFSDATPYVRAGLLALFFPFTLFGLLLVMGVKSEQQEARERKAKETEERKEREAFKQKAKDLDIPGWEHLP